MYTCSRGEGSLVPLDFIEPRQKRGTRTSVCRDLEVGMVFIVSARDINRGVFKLFGPSPKLPLGSAAEETSSCTQSGAEQSSAYFP